MADVTKNKEELQKRHYLYLEKLQLMVGSKVPVNFQPRLSFELLSSLSGSLLDGTVFAIVNNLSELQQLTERNHFNERTKILNDYSNQRTQLIKRHKTTEQACETRPHHLTIVQTANKREIDAFEKRMNDELHRFDIKLMNEMDKKLREQQETMNQAGVAGFRVTNDPDEIRVQMYLFEFILELAKLAAQ